MVLEFIKKYYAALIHLILFRTPLIPFNDGLFIDKKHRESDLMITKLFPDHGAVFFIYDSCGTYATYATEQFKNLIP